MYILKIIDLEGREHCQTIGEHKRLFSDFNEIEQEIEALEDLEMRLFGDVECIYEVCVWEEERL